jgi:hypothetical protein
LEVDVQQGNFKILQLLPQVLVLFWVEKWIPPRRLETAEIGQKNKRNFRGKDMHKLILILSFIELIQKKLAFFLNFFVVFF